MPFEQLMMLRDFLAYDALYTDHAYAGPPFDGIPAPIAGEAIATLTKDSLVWAWA